MGQLDGQVAVITGGGSGIGKGIARAFAGEGCAVVLAARGQDRLQATADELAADGAETLAIPTDVTDEGQVQALFAQVMGRWGRVDILVNNAAAFGGGRIDRLSREVWDRVIGVGLTGPFCAPARRSGSWWTPAGGGSLTSAAFQGSERACTPRPIPWPSTASGA